jgi:hypothetical protein
MNNRLLIAVLFVTLVVVGSVYADLITAQGSKAQDVYQLQKELVYAVNNKSLTSAALKFNATAPAKLETASACTVVNSGLFNSVAAVSSFTFSATTQIPAGKRGYIIVGVNSSDVFSTVHSPAVTYDHQLIVPMLAEGIAPVGLIKVIAAADGVFTPNTTLLNDASCTITISNLHSLPLSLDVKDR